MKDKLRINKETTKKKMFKVEFPEEEEAVVVVEASLNMEEDKTEMLMMIRDSKEIMAIININKGTLIIEDMEVEIETMILIV